ncbi:DNA-(apurinic or apyrimidinic site) lyase [Bacillus oleivorans]|uniref:DNA-(Apurinic or apyrimidinic site) lyase n=1 Tax=Bacillus oleivorans TaxID=1448271 RepID=A0A285CMI7_9BACI|nr:DNA-formamidopyrimidine glycosylase family protein [Bacillus oleivorans]SNX68762.1 DNA-(apurinic or apyrimidinic site) lyase [Bacillus oleivorans]
MPELPEMENYRQLLEQKLKNRWITHVEINREKSINVAPEIFSKLVLQSKVVHIERRAKHLLFHLNNNHVLLLHLMLGGWMFFGREEEKPDRTIQVRLSFGQHHLYFIGLRLGYLHLLTNSEADKELSDLGPEPLTDAFTFSLFQKLIENRRGRLKTKLVDQSFLSGIGNCYSDEICYLAKLLPTRDLKDLNLNQTSELYHSIRFVLTDALRQGGYMDQPLFKGDGGTGHFQSKVYDREGGTCGRCGSIIIKEMISSRKTFFCRGCQK